RGAEFTDIELKKEGDSYTAETLEDVMPMYPGYDIFLIMGSDMFLLLETWRDIDHLLAQATPVVLSRKDGDDREIREYAERILKNYSTKTVIIENDVTEISSTALRGLLPTRGGVEYLDDSAYAYIIKNRLYGAKADWEWLRTQVFKAMKPNRIPHTLGCETESVKLAARWGADLDEAREAAILHDITKHLELEAQLQLCIKYGIMTDNVEMAEVKLLHAKTGAAVARDIYGASQAVYDAIFWHTTGRADMSLLEKTVYIADYIEPTRDFSGLDKLRNLAYSDLDAAVIMGLQMSMDDLRSRGITPHKRTAEALAWFTEHRLQQ
ncbi:MAG: HD domain-containing protein, partial [Clostridiales bacterium]|nr:HD domain-containing protein [Clostridiales bacterium]